jgi:plastocyanin
MLTFVAEKVHQSRSRASLPRVQTVRAALFVGALLLGAASTVNAATASSPPTTKYVIVIRNFMYAPMKLTVEPGATVKVENKDLVDHTLTALDGKFNTGNIAPNKSKRFRAPKKPGTYRYRCSIHQFMKGSLIVE